MGIYSRIARITKPLVIVVIFVFVFVASLGISRAIANSISQGYKTTDASLRRGMAVSLDPEQEDKKLVTGATIANSAKFVGVITTVDDNLVSIRDQSSDLLVTTAGEVQAYVSDLDGQVVAGDFVAVTPVKGILSGAKNSSQQSIVGVALDNFADIETEERTIETQAGEQKTINVGLMPVQVGREFIPESAADQDKTFLVIAGESITGQSVNQAQVIGAILVLLIMMIVEGSIIYGAIHSTISALGRNPLSKKAVFKQLLQVSWLALLVLIFGFGVIFVILWI